MVGRSQPGDTEEASCRNRHDPTSIRSPPTSTPTPSTTPTTTPRSATPTTPPATTTPADAAARAGEDTRRCKDDNQPGRPLSRGRPASIFIKSPQDLGRVICDFSIASVQCFCFVGVVHVGRSLCERKAPAPWHVPSGRLWRPPSTKPTHSPPTSTWRQRRTWSRSPGASGGRMSANARLSSESMAPILNKLLCLCTTKIRHVRHLVSNCLNIVEYFLIINNKHLRFWQCATYLSAIFVHPKEKSQ